MIVISISLRRIITWQIMWKLLPIPTCFISIELFHNILAIFYFLNQQKKCNFILNGRQDQLFLGLGAHFLSFRLFYYQFSTIDIIQKKLWAISRFIMINNTILRPNKLKINKNKKNKKKNSFYQVPNFSHNPNLS